MKETDLIRLKSVVELSVRPVVGSIYRKLKIREELLSHLVEAVEELGPTSNDNDVTLHQAIRRFGEPTELASQLQTAVPSIDIAQRMLEKIWFQPDESLNARMARYVFVHWLILVAFVPVWIAWISAARALNPTPAPSEVALLFGSPYPVADVLLISAAFVLLMITLVQLNRHMMNRFQARREWENLRSE